MDPTQSDMMKPDWVANICHIVCIMGCQIQFSRVSPDYPISSKWINSNQNINRGPASNPFFLLLSELQLSIPLFSLHLLCKFSDCALTVPGFLWLSWYEHKIKVPAGALGWMLWVYIQLSDLEKLTVQQEAEKNLLRIKGSLIDLTVKCAYLLFWLN